MLLSIQKGVHHSSSSHKYFSRSVISFGNLDHASAHGFSDLLRYFILYRRLVNLNVHRTSHMHLIYIIFFLFLVLSNHIFYNNVFIRTISISYLIFLEGISFLYFSNVFFHNFTSFYFSNR